jgi:D-amino-acid dehydrogenase
VPGLDNTVLATGHNMLGVSLAPVTGQLVASLLLEQSAEIDLSPYSVSRFS